MRPTKKTGTSDLYGDLVPELRGFANRRLGNHAEAEDVVQEAFLRFQRVQTDRVIENPNGFLFRTIENLVIDRLRRRRIDPGPAKDGELQDSPSTITHLTPEDHATHKDELAQLLKIVSKLPRRWREVFLLSRVEGMTHAEIAKALGISKSTVEKHMVRALLALDDTLHNKDQEAQ